MAGSTVVVSVLADTKQFTEGFRDAGQRAGLLTKGLAIGAAAAGAAVVAVGAFAAKAIQAAGQSQVVAAQTSAVLKSTGEAAGRSAAQVSDLATKLSRISGVDDEVVQSAENMLLTFTQIKGDQFDQASAAALDLAQALGTDASSAAQTLGKALNDPVEGVSKLQRIGVTFTDEQQAQIENYAKMGDLASAQGVILAEVNKEFGGSAAAFGNTWQGAIAKFKTSWGNVLETVGGGLLPPLTAGLAVITDKLNALQDNPAFTAIIGKVSDFATALLSGSSPIAGFAAQVASLAGFFSPLGLVLKVIQPLLPQLGSAFAEVGGSLASQLAPMLPQITGLLGQLVGVLSGALAQVIPVLVPLITTLVQAIGSGLGAVLPAIIPIITALVAALGPVITAILPPLAQLFGVVADIVSTVLVPVIQQLVPFIVQLVQTLAPVISVVGQLVGTLLSALIPVLVAVIKPILDLIQPLLTLLLPVLTVLIAVIATVAQVIATVLSGAIQILVKLFSGDFAGALQVAQDTFGTVWQQIVALFQTIVGTIGGLIGQIGGFFAGIWDGIVALFQQGVANAVSVVSGLVAFFQSIPAQIASYFSGAIDWLADAGRNLIQGLINGVTGALDGLFGFINDVGSNIADTFANVLGIHSPSRVFAGFGRNVIAGLEQGLSASNSINAIMSGLGNQVAGSFNAQFDSLNVATDSSKTSGSVTPGQQINVQVTQNYPTTRDPIKTMRADAEAVVAGIWA